MIKITIILMRMAFAMNFFLKIIILLYYYKAMTIFLNANSTLFN